MTASPAGRRKSVRPPAEGSFKAEGSSSADVEQDHVEQNYSVQLKASRERLQAQLAKAEDQILGAVRLEGSSSELALSTMRGSVHGVIEWILRAVGDECETLSDGHRLTAREALKAKSAAFEAKLETSRTAAAVQMQEKAIEVEATMTRKMEEKAKEVGGEAGAQIREQEERIEELQKEVGTLKLKLSGQQEAVAKANEQIHAKGGELEAKQREMEGWQTKFEAAEAEAHTSKALAEEHVAELARVREAMDAALAALDVETQKTSSLEETVAEFVMRTEQLRVEAEQAREELSTALSNLGIVTEENVTLSEQVAKLVEQVNESKDLRAERDKLSEKARMLQGALEKLDAQNTTLRGEVEGLKEASARAAEAAQAELDAAKEAAERELASATEAAREELEALRAAAANAKASAEAAAREQLALLQAELDEAREAGAAGSAKLEAERARVAELEGIKERLEQEAKDASAAFAVLEKKLADAEEIAGKGGQLLAEEKEKGAALKKLVTKSMGILEQGLVKLNYPKPNEDDSLDARASALVNSCEAVMTKLEKAFTELNITIKANETLEQRLRSLVSECERGRAEAAEQRQRADDLVEQLAASVAEVASLQKEMAMMGKDAGGATKQIEFWKDKTAKLEAEREAAIAKIVGVLGKPAPSKPGNKRNHSPLMTQLDALIEKMNGIQLTLESMEQAASAGHAAMANLQSKLLVAEEGNSAALDDVRKEAQHKRQQLVVSALESMAHLRTYLVTLLTGMRTDGGVVHDLSDPTYLPVDPSTPKPGRGSPPLVVDGKRIADQADKLGIVKEVLHQFFML